MENKLAILYNELANQIITMIPTDFEEVYCRCEVEEGGLARTVEFYFKDSASNKFVRCYTIPDVYNVSKDIYRELHNELFGILDKIYAIFKEDGQELWTLLDMYFNKDGKFKVNFVYEPIDYEKYNDIARSVIWAYKKWVSLIPKTHMLRSFWINILMKIMCDF